MPRPVRLLASLLALLLGTTGCTIATPFRGPGYDLWRGPRDLDPDSRVVVSLTHATLKPGRRAPFDEHTRRVIAAIAGQPGLVGYSVRLRLGGEEAWTMTVWRDEESRARFVASPVHAEAMAAGLPSLERVRFRRLVLAAREIPLDWQRAEVLLDEASRGYGGAS